MTKTKTKPKRTAPTTPKLELRERPDFSCTTELWIGKTHIADICVFRRPLSVRFDLGLDRRGKTMQVYGLEVYDNYSSVKLMRRKK